MLSPADIPPGGEGEIQVTFDSSHRRGDQKKTVTVTSNDPVNSNVELTFKVKVEVLFGFETPHLSFGRTYEGEPVTKSAYLEVKDKSKTKIVDVTTSSPEIVARYVPKPDESMDNRYEIAVTVNPGPTTDRLYGSVTVKSNLSEKPEAVLQVSAYVAVGVEVVPQALTFEVISSGAPQPGETRTAKIINHDKKKTLTVLEGSDPEGVLSITIKPIVAGQEYEVTAQVQRDKLPENRRYAGQIILKTQTPEEQVVRIPYTLFQMGESGG